MIQKRFDQFESGLAMTDAKTKMLNLKIRAQPNQRAIQGEKEEQNDLEKLRLEMVEELRKVREDLRQANTQNSELIQEMKQMN